MMSTTIEKADLGLSLSLGFSSTNTPPPASSAGNRTAGPAALTHETTATTVGGVVNRSQAMPFHVNMMSAPHPHGATAAAATGFSPFGSPFHRYNNFSTGSAAVHAAVPFYDRDSDTCRTTTEPRQSLLRGIDVNRIPADADEDDAGVSSPNSTISSVSGKRTERETTINHNMNNNSSNNNNNIDAGCDDNDAERTSSRGGGGAGSDEDDGDTSRKKLRLSRDQSALLEETFKEHSTLNPKQKLALAKRLGLRPRQVEVWFQNRRARTKLKQTEVDCEFLKRCCEQLTEENRRLQKEVQDLRALKLSPQFYMQMTPPTTLTMCPSCERVGVPSNGPGPGPGSAAEPKNAANNPVVAAPLAQRPGPVLPWVAGPVRPFEGVHHGGRT